MCDKVCKKLLFSWDIILHSHHLDNIWWIWNLAPFCTKLQTPLKINSSLKKWISITQRASNIFIHKYKWQLVFVSIGRTYILKDTCTHLFVEKVFWKPNQCWAWVKYFHSWVSQYKAVYFRQVYYAESRYSIYIAIISCVLSPPVPYICCCDELTFQHFT